ncbi:MAG: hypothetical protein IPN70_05055 [Candidatus Moraniibacteriota bacterium]|nr:MAG: hypothetical protein IPN70_05055 [Candidatus Moranbacteria bacterium]
MSRQFLETDKKGKFFPSRLRKLRAWLRENKFHFLIVAIIFFSSVVSFEIGFLYAQEKNQKPLILEQVREDCPKCALSNKEESSTVLGQTVSKENTGEGLSGNKADCLFVGSKNSDKYHSPTCSWAKRIKPENIRCFKNAEEAKQAGYQEGCIQ